MLKLQIHENFKKRRDKLSKLHPKSAFLFPSNPEVLRNPDVHHPYRQESHFQYLSGFEEPESFLLMVPADHGGHESVFFVRPRDALQEIWVGERYGPDRVKPIFHADHVHLISELRDKLSKYLQRANHIFYRLGLDEKMDRLVTQSLLEVLQVQGRTGKSMLPISDPNEVVGEMRLIKDSYELDLMRKACKMTAEAHRQVMIEARPGMNENEVQAIIEFHFRKNGSRRLGYGSIVAGGKNATCLHYVENNEPVRDGDLLLIDAGTEYEYYTSDITRTFPVGKKFSQPQRQLYELVLKAQKEVLSICKPGTLYKDLHEKACEVLTQGLIDLKLIASRDELSRFYPHNTGHFLGMDVHDVGTYSVDGGKIRNRKLAPGMVFTVEPGLYCQPNDTKVPSEYSGIGIRIEDNVVITENGHEVMTSAAPKEIADIEALRRW